MPENLHIMFVGTTHPYRGGLASFNERLAVEFQKQGHRFDIYTFTLQYPSMLFPGKTQYTTEPEPENLSITRRVNAINPFNWWKIGKQIRKQKPDILLFKFWLPFMSPCFGTIARKTKKNKHTQVLAILDNVIPHEKRIGDKTLVKYFLKSVDGFVYMSENVKNSLDLFDKEKPRLFNPHPLFDNFGSLLPKEDAKKALGLDASRQYILFFGFIRDYKGLDLLIDAFADERFRDKNLRVIVAGEFYTDDKKYYDQVKKHNLEQEIFFFPDFIPDSKVTVYFSACDVVVQPYKSATQSGVTQIAYHFEKPMIVTGVGGLKELVPHNKAGYVVEKEPRAIADAIFDFYDKNMENNFIQHIKQEKEKYSWSRMIETIKKLHNLVEKNDFSPE